MEDIPTITESEIQRLYELVKDGKSNHFSITYSSDGNIVEVNGKKYVIVE